MNLVANVKEFGSLLKETFKGWSEREPFNNSIIISYYTIFSLPGLLIIIINIAGYFFGTKEVTDEIMEQFQEMIGGDTAKDVENIIATASQSEGTVLSSIIAAATLLFGATGVFYHTQQILNKIWEVRAQPKQKIIKLLKDRVFSFGFILVVGFLLLVSLVLSASLQTLSGWLEEHVSSVLVIVFKILDILLSISVVTILFAGMYKFLPDAKVKWRDVWMGAFLTAVLFVIAKFALGFYFGNSNPASTYGAAGSIILIMLWVSYSGMILLFGAEFTQVYAKRHGRKIMPTDTAVSTAGEDDNGAIVNKKPNKAVHNEVHQDQEKKNT